MNELVLVSKQGNVGILTVNNPPVNALSPGVPEGIAAGVEAFAQDDSVQAIVLIGGGKTFIAGADIKEFGKLTSSGDRRRGPGLNSVLNRIEASRETRDRRHPRHSPGRRPSKLPWLVTTGVGVSTAQVGQPEVKLGIIQGAGGTQRLPRLPAFESRRDVRAGRSHQRVPGTQIRHPRRNRGRRSAFWRRSIRRNQSWFPALANLAIFPGNSETRNIMKWYSPALATLLANAPATCSAPQAAIHAVEAGY